MVDGGGWLGRDPREEKPTADDAEPRTSLRYLAGCLIEIFHHHLTLCTLTLIGTCPVSLNSINTHVVTDNKKSTIPNSTIAGFKRAESRKAYADYNIGLDA